MVSMLESTRLKDRRLIHDVGVFFKRTALSVGTVFRVARTACLGPAPPAHPRGW